MTILVHASTEHEELHHKLQRIQGEAWGEYATLPERMSARISSGEVVIVWKRSVTTEEEGLAAELSADDTSAFRKACPMAISDVVESSNLNISDVVRESLDSLRKATQEWAHLGDIRSEVFRESLQPFTKASEMISLRDSLRTLFEGAHESKWTDAKNDRRCELIDREIEGTILPVEKRELDELQNQMLAYRRKVAPLPLKEAQRLHQELLKKAAEQED
jgi:hypothetical protein